MEKIKEIDRPYWGERNSQGRTAMIGTPKANKEAHNVSKNGMESPPLEMFTSSTFLSSFGKRKREERKQGIEERCRVRPNKPRDLHSLSLPPETFSPLATTLIPPVFSPAPNLPFPFPPLVFFRTPFSFPWIEKRWQIPRGVRCLLY